MPVGAIEEMIAMMITSEMIFYTGLAIIGFTILATAVVIPAFFLFAIKLRKRLEAEYGKLNNSEKK